MTIFSKIAQWFSKSPPPAVIPESDREIDDIILEHAKELKKLNDLKSSMAENLAEHEGKVESLSSQIIEERKKLSAAQDQDQLRKWETEQSELVKQGEILNKESMKILKELEASLKERLESRKKLEEAKKQDRKEHKEEVLREAQKGHDFEIDRLMKMKEKAEKLLAVQKDYDKRVLELKQKNYSCKIALFQADEQRDDHVRFSTTCNNLISQYGRFKHLFDLESVDLLVTIQLMENKKALTEPLDFQETCDALQLCQEIAMDINTDKVAFDQKKYSDLKEKASEMLNKLAKLIAKIRSLIKLYKADSSNQEKDPISKQYDKVTTLIEALDKLMLKFQVPESRIFENTLQSQLKSLSLTDQSSPARIEGNGSARMVEPRDP